MNKKGFTLIELLAVIVILALVMVVTIPNSIDSYKHSRLKAEEAFVKRLSQVVDEYVSLNIETMSFRSYRSGEEFTKPNQAKKVKVSSTNITVSNLINEDLISTSDYINPNNKSKSCSTDAQIEIYRDSGFVYCHKIKASSLDCITSEYIHKFLEDNSESYIVDTCIWE